MRDVTPSLDMTEIVLDSKLTTNQKKIYVQSDSLGINGDENSLFMLLIPAFIIIKF